MCAFTPRAFRTVFSGALPVFPGWTPAWGSRIDITSLRLLVRASVFCEKCSKGENPGFTFAQNLLWRVIEGRLITPRPTQDRRYRTFLCMDILQATS